MEKTNEKEFSQLMPEDRLNELLGILLPWGYSKWNNQYVGDSPYRGKERNVIRIVANDDIFGAPFSIVMERFNETSDEKDSLGFYLGVMKVIAPELVSHDDTFEGNANVIDFFFADEQEQANCFPCRVQR